MVGPDNGTFTDVIRDQGLDGAWEIDEEAFAGRERLSRTFHGRDIYGPVAGVLASGQPPDGIGRPIRDPVLLPLPEARRDGDRMEGVVRHVDQYGNIVTSIPAEWIPPAAFEKQHAVTVSIGRTSRELACAKTYADVAAGSGLVLVNSLGIIEVARNLGAASDLFPEARTGARVCVTVAQKR